MKINFSVKHGAFAAPLTGEQSFAIYRAVQEALTNIMKHSTTREAQVMFESPGGSVFRFEVTNFTAPNPFFQEGYGLKAMRDRLEKVGGSLNIHHDEHQFVVSGIIKVLLAEDQVMVRQGLKAMIETDEEIVVTGEADNGKEAVRLCEKQLFDLAILDIRMPEMDGIETAKVLRSRFPHMKILMLTTFDDNQYVMDALKSGVSGYMLKNGDTEGLIRSIKSAIGGGLSLEDQVAAKVMPILLQNQVEELIDPTLTPRERAILKCIGEGLNNKEIAERLGLSVGTVKNQTSHILDKLELRDRTQ